MTFAPDTLLPVPIHRLTVAQYHRMIESGVLTENDRVELLEGILVSKMPQNPSHDGTISIVLRRLRAKLPSPWIVRVQSAITLEDSEPEPDLAIVRGPEERYLSAHPSSSDIAGLLEVSDTTLEYDRNIKGRLYARGRIPIYWIINLVDFQIEVYTAPKSGKVAGYRRHRNYGIEESVPLIIDGREVGRFAVRRLLS